MARLAAYAMGLAAMSAPLSLALNAQENPGPGTLPSDIRDFRCLVLLEDRRDAYISAGELNADQVVIVNNLTIIAAFYAGRMSHYPTTQAQPLFDRVRAEIAAASDTERDAAAQSCAALYLNVVELLDTLESTPQ